MLLLPCQCLQRKCGIVIGYINIDAWKRLIKSTKMDCSRDSYIKCERKCPTMHCGDAARRMDPCD